MHNPSPASPKTGESASLREGAFPDSPISSVLVDEEKEITRSNMHRSESSSDYEQKGNQGQPKGLPIHIESETVEEPDQQTPSRPWWGSWPVKVKAVVLWTPKTCRYDPDNPPKFSIWMNLLFSFATTATVGNLYYNQPILYRMADTFNVSFEKSSSIATLMQAGYASGMLLICPLGDVFPRRPFILLLVAFTALMWLPLCLTRSFTVFSAISFVCGFTTVTPQLMLPLVGDLAPPHRRATALSVVVSGLALGMLTARVLSGIVANYTDWRNIYWFSFGAQLVVWTSLYFFMPDYPSKNPGGLNYFAMLWSVARLLFTEPVLAQSCLIAFSISAVFTSYWTTLSFLLSSPPYDYSSVAIGLFGLIGIFIICCGPIYSRYIIDKLEPLVSVVSGLVIEVAGVAVGVYIGTWTVGGPILQAIVIDFSNQAANIALRTVIYSIDPKARNRINTAYMISGFSGQLTGTAVGNRLYAEGGWHWSGSFGIGLICFALLVALARGPRETGWIGWHGGWAIRRDNLQAGMAAATPTPRAVEEGGTKVE